MAQLMIRPSRERIALLARQIVNELSRDGSAKLLRDRESIRQSVAQALIEELRHDEERVSTVAARIEAMPNPPPRGSREWTSLWQQLLDEEYERTRFESP